MQVVYLVPLYSLLYPHFLTYDPRHSYGEQFHAGFNPLCTVSPFMHRQLFFHSLPRFLRGHSQENKRNTLWILFAQVMTFQKSDKHQGQHSSNGKQKLMHKCFPLLIRSWGGQFQKSFYTFLKRPWTIESPVPTIKSTKKYVPLWNFRLSFFHLPWSPKLAPWGLVANTLSAPKVLTSALLSGREGFRLRLMDTNVCSALLRCVALSWCTLNLGEASGGFPTPPQPSYSPLKVIVHLFTYVHRDGSRMDHAQRPGSGKDHGIYAKQQGAKHLS